MNETKRRLLKTKKEAIEFLTWIGFLLCEALPQGRHALETDEGFCCLGVGTAVCIHPDVLKLDHKGQIHGFYPYHQYKAPNWLTIIESVTRARTGKSIAQMNDNNIPHPKIARFLLKEYEDELNKLLTTNRR